MYLVTTVPAESMSVCLIIPSRPTRVRAIARINSGLSRNSLRTRIRWLLISFDSISRTLTCRRFNGLLGLSSF